MERYAVTKHNETCYSVLDKSHGGYVRTFTGKGSRNRARRLCNRLNRIEQEAYS